MTMHCWKGRLEHMATLPEYDSHWYARWLAGEFGADGTCMLEAGHEGDHDFMPDDEIRVAFAESA